MPNSERYMIIPAVFLILKRDTKILLMKRQNTGFADGQYSLPSGHVEAGENLEMALLRETKEEIGIDLEINNLSLVHTSDITNDSKPYIYFYFVCEDFVGEPSNLETQKCSELAWFEIDNLPTNTLPAIKQAIALGLGWSENYSYFNPNPEPSYDPALEEGQLVA